MRQDGLDVTRCDVMHASDWMEFQEVEAEDGEEFLFIVHIFLSAWSATDCREMCGGG